MLFSSWKLKRRCRVTASGPPASTPPRSLWSSEILARLDWWEGLVNNITESGPRKGRLRWAPQYDKVGGQGHGQLWVPASMIRGGFEARADSGP